MTLSELQTLRAAAYSAYLAALSNGGTTSYSIDGRSKTVVSADVLLGQVNKLDAQITRATSGMAFASQFRKPE